MNRIIVALDFSSMDEASDLAKNLSGEVGGFKVGLELLMSVGPDAIAGIAELGSPVFADAKLHDIPNTVERAATRIRSAGARWVTAHAAGGQDMVRAAVAGMGGSGVLAVTALTSLSKEDLVTIRVADQIDIYAAAMAGLGRAAGAEGVVCSPGEIRAVKAQEKGLKVFTPGVRPDHSNMDDQKRVATPEEAREAGADYLVIGRPITRAPDPVEAARKIAASIATYD